MTLNRQAYVEGDAAFVPLTRGYVAIIDIVDLPLVEGQNWSALVLPRAVYAQRCEWIDGKRTTVMLHRKILQAPPGLQVDHINSNGLDNRRSNIRLASRSQNAHNQRRSCKNTSGFKGVLFDMARGKWRAQINLNGRHELIGCFCSAEAAFSAYSDAATRLHGEFARVS